MTTPSFDEEEATQQYQALLERGSYEEISAFLQGVGELNCAATWDLEHGWRIAPRTASVTLTVDIVLLTSEQHVLLIKRRKWPFQDCWALPGGKLHPGDESLEQAAARELREETGVQGLTLRQFRTYSNPGRDPRGYYVSTVYVARLEASDMTVQAGDDAKDARWFHVAHLPSLAFDHSTIVSDILADLDQQA